MEKNKGEIAKIEAEIVGFERRKAKPFLSEINKIRDCINVDMRRIDSENKISLCLAEEKCKNLEEEVKSLEHTYIKEIKEKWKLPKDKYICKKVTEIFREAIGNDRYSKNYYCPLLDIKESIEESNMEKYVNSMCDLNKASFTISSTKSMKKQIEMVSKLKRNKMKKMGVGIIVGNKNKNAKAKSKNKTEAEKRKDLKRENRAVARVNGNKQPSQDFSFKQKKEGKGWNENSSNPGEESRIFSIIGTSVIFPKNGIVNLSSNCIEDMETMKRMCYLEEKGMLKDWLAEKAQLKFKGPPSKVYYNCLLVSNLYGYSRYWELRMGTISKMKKENYFSCSEVSNELKIRMLGSFTLSLMKNIIF